MAGIKGKSGGPRPNAGGRRPGAGRPKGSGAKKSANAKPAKKRAAGVQAAEPRKEPLTFLEDVVNDPKAPLKDRIRAAVAAAQYRHVKTHDNRGSKEADADASKKAMGGRFAPKAPPKLVVSNK